MPKASHTIPQWQNIHNAGLGFNNFDFGTPVVNYEGKSDGGWLYLEGFEVTLAGKVYDAHITITKPLIKSPKSDEWTLCHFTVNRKGNCHVFYEVADGGGYGTTGNLLDFEGKNRQGKEHYKNATINDATIINAIDHDLRLVFQHIG